MLANHFSSAGLASTNAPLKQLSALLRLGFAAQPKPMRVTE
jgi:hypothetical protein